MSEWMNVVLPVVGALLVIGLVAVQEWRLRRLGRTLAEERNRTERAGEDLARARKVLRRVMEVM